MLPTMGHNSQICIGLSLLLCNAHVCNHMHISEWSLGLRLMLTIQLNSWDGEGGFEDEADRIFEAGFLVD